MFWMHLWAGQCGDFQDSKCSSPIFACGTHSNGRVKYALLFVGGLAAVCFLLPMARASNQLSRDFKTAALVVVGSHVGYWVVQSLALFLNKFASPLVGVDQTASNTDSSIAESRIAYEYGNANTEHSGEDEEYSNVGEPLHWSVTLYMSFAMFFLYSLIRVWASIASSELCSIWTNPMNILVLLVLLLTLQGHMSCTATYNMLEDLVGMFWMGISIFLFGRAFMLGTQEGDDCLSQVVVPRIFLLLVAHAIPYISSITYTTGYANVILKTAVGVLFLLLVVMVDKQKKEPLKPHKCNLGPESIQNGRFVEPEPSTHYDGEKIVQYVTCNFGFENIDALALCRCSRQETDKCIDLVGELSPCQTREKVFAMGYAVVTQPSH